MSRLAKACLYIKPAFDGIFEKSILSHSFADIRRSSTFSCFLPQESSLRYSFEVNPKAFLVNRPSLLDSSDEQFDVLATLPGTVTNIKDDNILGKVVYVEYNTKLTVVYYSLESTDLKIGDQIDQDTVIGKSGSNKLESQKKYNLLIEVYKDGNLINPLDFYEMNVNELNN